MRDGRSVSLLVHDALFSEADGNQHGDQIGDQKPYPRGANQHESLRSCR